MVEVWAFVSEVVICEYNNNLKYEIYSFKTELNSPARKPYPHLANDLTNLAIKHLTMKPQNHFKTLFPF